MITESDMKLQRRLIGLALESSAGRDAVALVPDAWFTDHAARLARQILNDQRPVDRMAFATIVLSTPHLFTQFSNGALLPDFADHGISPSGTAWHIEQLRQSYIRHAVECFPDAIKLATTSGMDGDERLGILETAINQIRQTSEAGQSSYAHIREGVRETMEDIEAAQTAIHRMEPGRAIPTGIEDLDACLFGGGVQPGQIVYVGARPGIGKSSLLVNVALNMAANGRKVGVVSLEMTRRELAAVGAQVRSELNLAQFYVKSVETGQLAKMIAGLESIAGHEIYVDDSSTLTVEQVVARLSHMVRVERCEVAFIDYAQKIAHSGKGETVQELAHISDRLTQAAKDLQIPLIVLAQLNRDVENKVPGLSNFKGSGQFEQDAHIALLLHRPELTTQGIDIEKMEIHIAKQRRGVGNACVAVRFDRQTQAIY